MGQLAHHRDGLQQLSLLCELACQSVPARILASGLEVF